MKKWIVIVAFTLSVVFVASDVVHDFITDEPIHYFALQPSRLLWVAAIAIGGGLIAQVFHRLSPRLQRRAKLFAIGSAAICVTAFAGYLLCYWGSLSLDLGAMPGTEIMRDIAGPFGAAAWLWFEFFRVSKKRV